MFKVFLVTFLVSLSSYSQENVIQSSNGCSGNESWQFFGQLEARDQKMFQASLSKSIEPIQSFSEAIAMRKLALDNTEKNFSEYWIAKSLYDLKFYSQALLAFDMVLSSPTKPQNLAIQLAAIECSVRILFEQPGYDMGFQMISKLPTVLQVSKSKEVSKSQSQRIRGVLLEASSIAIRTLLYFPSSSSTEKMISKLLPLLDSSSAHSLFTKGILAQIQNKPNQVIHYFSKLKEIALPVSLKQYKDFIELSSARAFYSAHHFKRAGESYASLSRASNQINRILVEQSWSEYMDENYGKAIGTATSLRAGGLRKTFAPESQMIVAFSLNELCQFPKALEAMQIFRKDYKSTFDWLQKWKKNKTSLSLYQETLKYLKMKNSGIPDRIASEWLKHPSFISHQEILNQLYTDDEKRSKVVKSAALVQNRKIAELKIKIASLKKYIPEARDLLEQGKPLKSDFVEKLKDLRDEALHYSRLKTAAPVWMAISRNADVQSENLKKTYKNRIESDLRVRTLQMSQEVLYVAENLQLAEIEIYEGATKDIIWQNAHPDYKEVVEKIYYEENKKRLSQVWDWGRAPASEDHSEIWEDELGNFSANMFDNCDSKDKYIKVKFERPST